MFTPSVKLGEARGIDFKISIGWLFIFGALAYILRSPAAYNQYLDTIRLLTFGTVTIAPAFPESELLMTAFTVTTLLGVYLSVILHEIGHATAARKTGISVESISLWMAGGVANIEAIPVKKEFFITIMGPTVTALLVPTYAGIAALLFALNMATVAWVFALLTLFNLGMLVFNLMPLLPLDGGRILRSLLTRTTTYANATTYALYATLSVVGIAVITMIATGVFDYMFISIAIGFLGYMEYKRFKQTRNANNAYVYEEDQFFICDQAFALDTATIPNDLQNKLNTHIRELGGHVATTEQDADYLITNREPYTDNAIETPEIPVLVVLHKLDKNGVDIPEQDKNRFKL